jgi:uncharacterized protein
MNVLLFGRATLNEIKQYGINPPTALAPFNSLIRFSGPGGLENVEGCHFMVIVSKTNETVETDTFTLNDVEQQPGRYECREVNEICIPDGYECSIYRNLINSPLPAPQIDQNFEFIKYQLNRNDTIDFIDLIVEYYTTGSLEFPGTSADKFMLRNIMENNAEIFSNIHSDKVHLCPNSYYRRNRLALIEAINYMNLSADWLDVFGMWSDDVILLDAADELGKLLPKSKDDTHGLLHAQKVLSLAERELQHWELSQNDALAIKLAALLHDADDRKLFPDSTGNENTKKILDKVLTCDPKFDKLKNLIMTMISQVSFSENANNESIPAHMLIPRHADRIEALGNIGIYRAYTYGRHNNREVFTDHTPVAHNEDELKKILTKERLYDYLLTKTSQSTIDHLYDKVLQISRPQDMKYLSEVYDKQMNIVWRFVIDFWNNPDYEQQRQIIPKLEFCSYTNFCA